MKIKLLFFLFVLFNFSIFGQDCATDDISEAEYQSIPWYGAPDVLTDFYDSLENAYNSSSSNARTISIDGIESPWYRVPVKFWVYQEALGVPGSVRRLPTQRDYQRMLDELNEGMRRNGIHIRFFMECHTDRFEPQFQRFIDFQKSEARDMADLSHQDGAVNIHIVDAGGNRYDPLANCIILDRAVYTDFTNQLRSITHEVGHFFGLLHTHFGQGTFCLDEPVSRGIRPHPCNALLPFPLSLIANAIPRCYFTGDLLRSTEADPNMSPSKMGQGNQPDRQNCTYIGGRLYNRA